MAWKLFFFMIIFVHTQKSTVVDERTNTHMQRVTGVTCHSDESLRGLALQCVNLLCSYIITLTPGVFDSMCSQMWLFMQRGYVSVVGPC